MLTHLYDDRGAWTQRKNAANKLQHSGVATLAVYHNRHRVVHHIDMAFAGRVLSAPHGHRPGLGWSFGALERGPDFAERLGVHLLETSAWDMGHTALC